MLTTYLKSGNKQFVRSLVKLAKPSVSVQTSNLYRNQMMKFQIRTASMSILRAQDDDENKEKPPKGFEKFFKKNKENKKADSESKNEEKATEDKDKEEDLTEEEDVDDKEKKESDTDDRNAF